MAYPGRKDASEPFSSPYASRRGGGGTSFEINNYHLHEQTRQDELAIVYVATHQTLDRPVQVHILRRPDWVSSSRFQLAARLAARLDHPHLLPVIDAGHDTSYGDYLVTPMLNARPLSDILEEHRQEYRDEQKDGQEGGPKPLAPLLVLRIATQLASVVDYLHANDVYHRDIQPANVLVTPDGVAYLTNLGLAASPDTPDLSSVDEADYLTPYSAPEQRLDQGEASPALDIYSLGALLYHLFSGEMPPAPGMEIVPLASRDPSLRDVDPVLLRMLEVSPQSRFASASEAVAALRRALSEHIDRSTEDMEESRWEPTAEWMENPLETVFGQLLSQEYISRSHTRADTLHRADAIRRLLNRWSNKGWLRRSSLGHIVELEQIVSYNIYFYELHALYESRVAISPRQRPIADDEQKPILPMPDIWEIPVPAGGGDGNEDGSTPAFRNISQQPIVWPNSQRVITCATCEGKGLLLCKTCQGKGMIVPSPGPQAAAKAAAKTAARTAAKATGGKKEEQPRPREIREPQPCPDCHGEGYIPCPDCQQKGQVIEEQMIAWSRKTHVLSNTDDIDELPRLALRHPQETVYEAAIDPYEGRWHSVAPLNELLREAITVVGKDVRFVRTELHIRGVPVTEVDYRLDKTPLRLYIIGDEQNVVGSWHLLNLERLFLVVGGGTILLILGVVLFFVLF